MEGTTAEYRVQSKTKQAHNMWGFDSTRFLPNPFHPSQKKSTRADGIGGGGVVSAFVCLFKQDSMIGALVCLFLGF